jgi:hypothetical protein
MEYLKFLCIMATFIAFAAFVFTHDPLALMVAHNNFMVTIGLV